MPCESETNLKSVHHTAVEAICHIVQDKDNAIEVQFAQPGILVPLDSVPGSVGEEELALGWLLDVWARALGNVPGEETHVGCGYGALTN